MKKIRRWVDVEFIKITNENYEPECYISVKLGIINISAQLTERQILDIIHALVSPTTQRIQIDIISVTSGMLPMKLIDKKYPVLNMDNIGVRKFEIPEELCGNETTK